MADKKKLSMEEILAACRQADGGGGGGASPAAEVPPAAEASSSASEESAPQAPPATEKPAPKPAAAAAAKSGKKSVSDILAAARAERAASGESAVKAEKASPKPAPQAKPKPSAAGADAPAKAPAKAAKDGAKPAGPKDTASILAAARKGAKPGPMSKAEAAAKGQTPAARPAKTKLDVPPMPARPAYVQTPSAHRATDRRGFFTMVSAAFVGSSLAIGFTSLALTHILWLLGLARFMFPNILTEPPTQFKVGFPDEFAPGQVETKYKAQFGVWIARYEYEGQQQIYALRSVCTHLGCTPNWLEGEQKFKCPCHGSGFYKDGINFEGPAPRPLERYAIKLADDGQLEVDKSRKFNQELGQWADAASYVPV